MRYYQPTQSEFLDDAMYQHPIELMTAAIEASDKRFNTFLDKKDEYDKLIQVDPLDVDKEDANNIVGELRSRSEELAQKADKGEISMSILNRDLRQLRKDITKEVVDPQGRVYNVNKNKKDRDALYQATLKKYRENPEDFPFIKDESEIAKAIDSQYPGYMNEEGGYNTFPEYSLAGREQDFDIVKKLFAEKLGKNYLRTSDYETFTTTLENEGWTPNQIKETIASFVNSDESLKKSYEQELAYRKARGEEGLTLEDVTAENVKKLEDLSITLKEKQRIKDIESPKKPTGDDPTSPGRGKRTTNTHPDISKVIDYVEDNPLIKQGLSSASEVMEYGRQKVSSLNQELENFTSRLTDYSFDTDTNEFTDSLGKVVDYNTAISNSFHEDSVDIERNRFEDLIKTKTIHETFSHNEETASRAIEDAYIDKQTPFSTNPHGLLDKETYKSIDEAIKNKGANEARVYTTSLETDFLAKGYIIQYKGETYDEAIKRYISNNPKKSRQELVQKEILQTDKARKEIVKASVFLREFPPLLKRETRVLKDKNSEEEGKNKKESALKMKGAEQNTSSGNSGVKSSYTASDETSSLYESAEPSFTGTTMFPKDPSDFSSPVASQTITMGNLDFEVIVDMSDIAVDDASMEVLKQIKRGTYSLKELYSMYPTGFINSDGSVSLNMAEGTIIYLKNPETKQNEEISLEENTNGQKFFYWGDKKVTDSRTIHFLVDQISKRNLN